MNISNAQLGALISHWLGKISATLFAVLSFIYWEAASSSDRRVSQSIAGIAAATGLPRRTVQPGLRKLATLGAIEILSSGKERMLIQVPTRYWLPPVNVPRPDVAPATVPELILRLCGQRPTAEMLAFMKATADNDEPRLQNCLDSFFRQGKRWTTLELLTVAVQDDLKPRNYFDRYWSQP